MRPSETTSGQAWLSNFHPSHTDTARLLLDSLDIVSDAQIRSGLERRIRQLEVTGGAVLLVPVLGINDIERLIDDVPPSAVGKHVAYETYAPGKLILATPGSEAVAGSVIRGFTGDNPATQRSPRRGGTRWLHPGTPKEELAERKCRRIVLVTDYSGSGRQIVEFAETFARNRTIRSWRSSGLVRITALAYAASLSARAIVEASWAVDELVVERPARAFHDMGWAQEDMTEIEKLCRTYSGEQRGAREQALGLNESRGLFATHSSVPNNLPFVLRRYGGDWQSFFPGRNFPDDLRTELGDYQGRPASLRNLAMKSRQQRLARVIDSGRLTSPTDLMVVTMALLAHRQLGVAELAHHLHRSDAEVQQLVDYLQISGMLTPQLAITSRGRAEIQAAKRLERVVTARLTGSTTPYYPQSLR